MMTIIKLTVGWVGHRRNAVFNRLVQDLGCCWVSSLPAVQIYLGHCHLFVMILLTFIAEL